MKKFALLSILAVPALAGCNTTTEGANGAVFFTPMNCGRLSCDFDDSVGVGGRLDVVIEGAEGVSTAGVVLESDDPSVLFVEEVPDIGGRPAWNIEGVNPGVARLIAYDGDFELDFLEVGVQELSYLAMMPIVGDAVGPDTSSPDFDEVWTVNADEAVSLQVTPYIGVDAPTMGVYTYTATIDAGLEEGLLDDDLSDGYLYFQVPAGEYAVSFVDDLGHAIDVLVVAQGASAAR